MKYDDASWHYGGDFPSDLPNAAGGTHIGMFVSWCLLNGLGGEIHAEEFPDILEKLRNRGLTPGAWFFQACDGEFTDEDLSEEGNDFAKNYFDFDVGQYLDDYQNSVGSDLPTLYHVSDTWQTFDVLSPIIQGRYQEWKT